MIFLKFHEVLTLLSIHDIDPVLTYVYVLKNHILTDFCEGLKKLLRVKCGTGTKCEQSCLNQIRQPTEMKCLIHVFKLKLINSATT